MSLRITQRRDLRGLTGAVLLLTLTVFTGCSDKGPAAPPDVVVGPPAQLIVAGGDRQAAEPGAPLRDSLVVRVADAAGKPVGGVAVSWSVASGGGALSTPSTPTDASGHARTAWTLGPTENAQSVTAVAGTLPPATFTATGTVKPDGTGTIGVMGGVIGLPDGTRVVFPAGAVSAGIQATVAKLDAAQYVASGAADRAVVSVTAGVSRFNVPVEIRLPMPAGMTAADSPYVRVGLIDEANGAITTEPASLRTIDGTLYAVVAVTHFSKRLFEWLVGKQPPASAGPFVVPYFNQGASNFCWAASVHMLTQAVRPGDLGTITDIIGTLGVNEGGITSGEFRYGSGIAELVRRRTGQDPRRQSWDYLGITTLLSYLREEIGLNGRPVALFNGVWEHAVVVLGYSGLTFYIHDPAATATGGVGYQSKTWAQIIAGMNPTHNMVTLAIPAAPTAGDSPVRINFMPQSVEFRKPQTAPDDPSAIWHYVWDHTTQAGYSMRHLSTGDPANPFPGPVTTIAVPGDIQISNASRTSARQATVWTEIIPLGAPSGYSYEVSQEVTIAPNSLLKLTMNPVDVDTFRFNQLAPTEYAFTVRVMDGGVLDLKSFYFKIAPLTPELKTIIPAAAAVGDTVRITGRFFGPIAERGDVRFSGVKATKIVSWAADEIRLVVPQGAATGKVVVKNGEVPSNGVDFEVLQTQTISGQIDFTDGHVLQGSVMSMTGTWSLTGKGPRLSHQVDGNYFSLRTGIGVPGVLDLQLNPSIEPLFVTITYPDGRFTEILYKPVIGTDVDKTGDFPVSSSQQGSGNHTFEFTMNGYNQSLSISIWFEVRADITWYNADATVNHSVTDHYYNQRTAAVFYLRAE